MDAPPALPPVCDGEICSCAVGFGVDSARLAWFLAERGIQLSRPQVYRVVHQRPERVSLQLMAALCDIFGSGVDDLVTVMPNWSADESCSGLGSFDPSGARLAGCPGRWRVTDMRVELDPYGPWSCTARSPAVSIR